MKWIFIIIIIFTSIFHIGVVSAESDSELKFDGTTITYLTKLNASKIILRENASLTIQNIEMETIFYNESNTINVKLYDNSKISISNSSIPASIQGFNSSRIEIYNSSVFHASWCRVHHSFHNGSGLFVHDNSEFIAKNSKIGYIRADP